MRAPLQSELTELAAERGELISQGLCFLGLGKCDAVVSGGRSESNACANFGVASWGVDHFLILQVYACLLSNRKNNARILLVAVSLILVGWAHLVQT